MKLRPFLTTAFVLGLAPQGALAAQTPEKYTISTGDTLGSISQRLFGDAKYWPKLWAINHQKIPNPHQLKVGDTLLFSPGTETSLPDVILHSAAAPTHTETKKSAKRAPASSSSTISNKQSAQRSPASDHSPPPYKKKKRSEDWKSFPRQKWESYNPPLPPEIDPLGFDKNNKIVFHGPTGFYPQAIPSTEKITLLGQITGARSPSQYLDMEDSVYITTTETVETGRTYALTDGPTQLKDPKSERPGGYSYNIIGHVKIVAAQDNVFIGTVTSASDFIPRGSFLMRLPERIPVLEPTPGPPGVTGTLLLDHHFSTYTTAQYKEVFIDRGSQDGIQPGMVFRAYQYTDPSNSEKITDSDIIINADFIVTQVSATISSAIVLRSKTEVHEFAKVVLLTDVSDLVKNEGFKLKTPGEDELEELDKDNSSDTLNPDEKKTLQQLEDWKGNPEGSQPGGADLPAPPNPDEPAPELPVGDDQNAELPGPPSTPPDAPSPPADSTMSPPADEGDVLPPPPSGDSSSKELPWINGDSAAPSSPGNASPPAAPAGESGLIPPSSPEGGSMSLEPPPPPAALD